MYGHEPRLPIEMKIEGSAPCNDRGSSEVSLDEKAQQLLRLKKSVHDVATKNIKSAQERQKKETTTKNKGIHAQLQLL